MTLGDATCYQTKTIALVLDTFFLVVGKVFLGHSPVVGFETMSISGLAVHLLVGRLASEFQDFICLISEERKICNQLPDHSKSQTLI